MNNNDLNNQNLNASLPTESVSEGTVSTHITDDELLKVFIGKNYEKITTKRFNFATFFFNSFYMFYRKMIGYGLITALVTGLLLNFIHVKGSTLNIIIQLAIMIIIGVIAGMFVNKVYVNLAKRKINKIKEKNPDKTSEELKAICTSKGGTSIGFIFLGLFAIILLAIVLGIILMLLGFTTIWGITSIFNNYLVPDGNNEDDFEDDLVIYTRNAKNGIFDGTLFFESNIDISSNVTITVPEKFTDNSYDSAYNYSYNGTEGIFNECRAGLNSPMVYDDAKTLIGLMSNFYKDMYQEWKEDSDLGQTYSASDVSMITNNNSDWYFFTKTDDIGTSYYYGTTKNDKVFLFEYDVNTDADSDCEGYRESIFNSIEIK